MKKVLIGCGLGCGAVLLIGLLVVGYVGWRFSRFANEFAEQMADVGERFEQLDTQFPFMPPDDGLVKADRMDIWLQIRRDLVERGDRFTETFKHFSSTGWVAGLPAVKDEFLELADDGIEVFETAGIAPEEYRWIRGLVIGALSSGDARDKPEIRELVEAFDKVDGQSQNGPAGESVRSMGAPVTSEQIEHICALLTERKEAFLAGVNTFYADVALEALVEGTSSANESEPDRRAVQAQT